MVTEVEQRTADCFHQKLQWQDTLCVLEYKVTDVKDNTPASTVLLIKACFNAETHEAGATTRQTICDLRASRRVTTCHSDQRMWVNVGVFCAGGLRPAWKLPHGVSMQSAHCWLSICTMSHVQYEWVTGSLSCRAAGLTAVSGLRLINNSIIDTVKLMSTPWSYFTLHTLSSYPGTPRCPWCQ